MSEAFFLATVKNKNTGLRETDLAEIFYGGDGRDSATTPLHRMIKWEVTDVEKEKDSFSFTLDNWDLSLFDSPLFKKGNEVTFQYGYADNMSQKFVGIINKRSGWTVMTISGTFKSEVAISERQASQKWTNKKLSDVAKELFEAEGFSALVDDTKVILPVIIRQNETVLQFLKRKAGEVPGAYEVYVEGSVGCFVKKKLKNKPIAVLKYGTEIGDEEYVTAEEPEYRDEQEAKAVEETVKGFDILKKKPITEKGNTDGSEQTSLGKGTYYFDKGVGGFQFRPPGAQKTAETGLGKPTNKQTAETAGLEAQSGFDKKKARAFSLAWKIYGNPKIKAKEVVTVECDSKEISGNWYIEKVTHSGDGGSFYSELDLIRNATGAAVGTVESKGGVNNQPADASKSNERSYVFDPDAGKFRPKL